MNRAVKKWEKQFQLSGDDLDHIDGGGPFPMGAQTLGRGLEILSLVGSGKSRLPDLARSLALPELTTRRLVNALIDQEFIRYVPRAGYLLGPSLLRLGAQATSERRLCRSAQRMLLDLAIETGEIAFFGQREQSDAYYALTFPGSNRLQVNLKVGHPQPVLSTVMGKALSLNQTEQQWARAKQLHSGARGHANSDGVRFETEMRLFRELDIVFGAEPLLPDVHTVAAPVRDVAKRIVGAIGVSGLSVDATDKRIRNRCAQVTRTAQAISGALAQRG